MPYAPCYPSEDYIDIKFDERESLDVSIGSASDFGHTLHPPPSYCDYLTCPLTPNVHVSHGGDENLDMDPDLISLFYSCHDYLPDGRYTQHIHNSGSMQSPSPVRPRTVPSIQIPDQVFSNAHTQRLSASPNAKGSSTLQSGNHSAGVSPYSSYTTTSDSTLETPATGFPRDSQAFLLPLPPPSGPRQVGYYCKEDINGIAAAPTLYVPEYPSPSAATADFIQCSIGRAPPSQSSATYNETEMCSNLASDWAFAQESSRDCYAADDTSQSHISQLMSLSTLNELPGGIVELVPTSKTPHKEVATERVVAHARSRRKYPNKKGQHICHICERDFTAPHNLKHHINSHEGKKPYHCECGDSFTTPRSLKRHKITKHGDNKPTDSGEAVKEPNYNRDMNDANEMKPIVVADLSRTDYTSDYTFWASVRGDFNA